MKTHKKCKKCDEVKTLEEFPRCDNCYDGRRNICRDCRSAQKNTLYYKNHENYIALNRKYRKEDPTKQRQYRLKVKQEVMFHYGNGKIECTECGFNDIRALCIDHIDGLGSIHRKKIDPTGTNGAGTHMYRWLKRNDYPEGFQVLCSNCNLIKECEQRDSRQLNVR